MRSKVDIADCRKLSQDRQQTAVDRRGVTDFCDVEEAFKMHRSPTTRNFVLNDFQPAKSIKFQVLLRGTVTAATRDARRSEDDKGRILDIGRLADTAPPPSIDIAIILSAGAMRMELRIYWHLWE
jgi:hypothetical protein